MKPFCRFCAILSMVFCCLPAIAQIAPADTSAKISPVRTMSYTKYNAYLKGIDVDSMGFVGAINHAPTPDKVLKYKKEIWLTPEQVKKLQDIQADMHMHMVQAGQSAVANEKTLDEMFRTKRMDEGSLIYYTNRYGLYLGEMRNAVLQACYHTQKVLTQLQMNKFETLQKAN